MPQYAVIEASGGQLRVAAGDELLVDLIDGGEAAIGKAVAFDHVLCIGGDAGATKFGTPYLKGASIAAEVLEPIVMGEKIHIYKHREKKTYKRKTGHRQRYTKVRITAIAG